MLIVSGPAVDGVAHPTQAAATISKSGAETCRTPTEGPKAIYIGVRALTRPGTNNAGVIRARLLLADKLQCDTRFLYVEPNHPPMLVVLFFRWATTTEVRELASDLEGDSQFFDVTIVTPRIYPYLHSTHPATDVFTGNERIH
jgi:hypothetical protein